MKADNIRVNQLAEIEYGIDPDNVEYLPSRVEGKTDRYLYLAVPISKGELVPLRIGSKIKVFLYEKEHSYCFNTIITGRQRKPLPILQVNMPEELIKVQRRSFFRLPVNLEVTFSIYPDTVEHKGTTLNISGGGVLILTKANLRRKQFLDFRLNLPGREPIYCKAQVIRILHKAQSKQKDNKVAINFIEINEVKRDIIFHFIFEKQREWIQKGILD